MSRAENILRTPFRAGRWSCILTITPEQAKAILECQPIQRPVDQGHVKMLAGEITAGRFILTHQGLAFDENGLLFDGQHRLWACILAGIGITVWVFFNEPRENFDVVDTRNKARTTGQLAVAKGQFDRVEVANMASAAARFIYAYDLGLNPTTPTSIRFMSREMDAVMEAHPGVPAMVEKLGRGHAARRVRLPAAPAIGLFTLFAEADAAKADTFLHQVLTGENLSSGDPALTLRNSAANAGATHRTRSVDFAYRIVRAWNSFHAGRPIAILYGAATPHGPRLRQDGRNPFPDIAGYVRPANRPPQFGLGV